MYSKWCAYSDAWNLFIFFLSLYNTLNSFDYLFSCLFHLIGLKKFIDVDLSTCDKIAFYLDKDVPFGLGGNRQAADVFGMTKDMIGALATSKSPGQVIVEFVKATKPDITVYEVFKQLKGDEMKRFDIAKILENHLTITESEV